MKGVEKKEYVCLRLASGTVLITEYYLVEDGDEDIFVAVNPIEVISLGFVENEAGQLTESLFYKKYIRFSDEFECPISGMNVEHVVALSQEVIGTYEKYVPEFYGVVPEKEDAIPEEVKNKVNVIIGQFNSKKSH